VFWAFFNGVKHNMQLCLETQGHMFLQGAVKQCLSHGDFQRQFL
jgi:hypothetical protein